MPDKKPFKLRAFISVYMTITSILIAISGIILYIAPPGRIAHWSYWSMLGLTKDEWQGIHIIFTFILVVAGIAFADHSFGAVSGHRRRGACAGRGAV